jgi:hypothetical protein
MHKPRRRNYVDLSDEYQNAMEWLVTKDISEDQMATFDKLPPHLKLACTDTSCSTRTAFLWLVEFRPGRTPEEADIATAAHIRELAKESFHRQMREAEQQIIEMGQRMRRRR